MHFVIENYNSDNGLSRLAQAAAILSAVSRRPDPWFMLDIAELADESLHVLELNSFSCSALCGVDADALVEQLAGE